MRSLFGYTASYEKAWSAKQKAIARAFGNWESSYALLPRWMATIQKYILVTVVKFCNKKCPDDMRNDDNMAFFHRVFWAFKPCIDAFDYLKSLIQIDGTFLYGKYRGTLLIATSQDSDRHVVPLAFAIVEGETTEAWTWFLMHLRLHVAKHKCNICLISDRHTSILAAIQNRRLMWSPP